MLTFCEGNSFLFSQKIYKIKASFNLKRIYTEQTQSNTTRKHLKISTQLNSLTHSYPQIITFYPSVLWPPPGNTGERPLVSTRLTRNFLCTTACVKAIAAHRSRRRAKRAEGPSPEHRRQKATSVTVPPSGTSAVGSARCRLTGSDSHGCRCCWDDGTALRCFQESLSELACFINSENIPSQCKHGFTRIVIIVLLSLHEQL